jgi:hydrogenase expression/formation protein HypD
VDAHRRFTIDLAGLPSSAPPELLRQCICGQIMSGLASPRDCALFGKECVPDSAVGACMVSSEGACRIWHQYGAHSDLGSFA